MPNERIDAKVGYNVFKDNISTYISSTFKNGADVVSIVSEGLHPRKAFKDRYLLKDKDEDELKKSKATVAFKDVQNNASGIRNSQSYVNRSH